MTTPAFEGPALHWVASSLASSLKFRFYVLGEKALPAGVSLPLPGSRCQGVQTGWAGSSRPLEHGAAPSCWEGWLGGQSPCSLEKPTRSSYNQLLTISVDLHRAPLILLGVRPSGKVVLSKQVLPILEAVVGVEGHCEVPALCSPCLAPCAPGGSDGCWTSAVH